DRMRVLHLVDGYPPAGGCAGRWCQGLSRALVRRDVAVQVLSATSQPDGSELASGGGDIDEGVRVQRVVMRAPLYLLRRLRPGFRTRPPRPWSGALRGLLVRAAAAHDVVHMHGVVPPHAWWAVLGCRLARRPLVYSPGLHDRRALTASVRLLRLAGLPVVPAIVSPGRIDDWLRRLWHTSLVPIVGIVVADAAERAGVLAAADLIVLPDHSCAALLWGGVAETPILAPQREGSPAPDG